MSNRIFIPKNELKNLYEKKKLTSYDIANIFDCCQGTVWKRLEEYGIKRFPNGRTLLNGDCHLEKSVENLEK